ncbi:MAG TPA: glycosyltransferase family 39 protein, partial [Pyrinomonadaceae bacterium]|nr:glycosyltransferase family 39 protein [Pyrinomonadaceae bacterium]
TKNYNDYDNLYWKFWRANAARFDELSFWARVPVVALTLALGVLIFVYARRLFGARAAALSVVLFAVEPTLLAHGRVVQTDVAAAFTLLLFCLVLDAYLRAPSLAGALITGAVCALAVCAKFSLLVLVPVAVLTPFVLTWTRRAGWRCAARFAAHACASTLVMLLTINAAYLFRTHTLSDFALDDAGLPGGFGAGAFGAFLTELLPRIVPADFIEGVLWQVGHQRAGHEAGLLGEYSTFGWWYYFPVAFALKTTLPFLLLTLASLAWGMWRVRRRRERALLLVIVPPVLYALLLAGSQINIGVRYLLPAYPFLFILSGALLERLLRSHRLRRTAALAVALVLAWATFEVARAYPDYMPYMNQLARGAPRWHYLSDSNVEWGDDVRALARYLLARGESRVHAAVLGDRSLHVYGVEDVEPRDVRPGSAPERARYVAIGASFFNGSVLYRQRADGTALGDDERRNTYALFRTRRPEAVFGGSIYLYRLDD